MLENMVGCPNHYISFSQMLEWNRPELESELATFTQWISNKTVVSLKKGEGKAIVLIV